MDVVKKMIVVLLSTLAIFAVLALIRYQNNMLVSEQAHPSAEKSIAKKAAVDVRDV